jgi:GNAT superfamily N-acetyltransferase
MVVAPNILNHEIELHRGEFSRDDLNGLSGVLRLASNNPGHLVTRHQLAEELDRYRDPDKTGHYLFIGRVAFNHFADDMDVTGFATMRREAKGHHIDRVFVHSVARGRRLGHQLVEACIGIAAEAKGYLQYDQITQIEEDKRLFADLNFAFTPHPVVVPYLEFDK